MTRSTDAKRPRLRNLDDLYMLESPGEGSAPRSGGIIEIDLKLTVPFAKHPFHLYTGERLEDMVESVRENGVLVPIIVRRSGDNYEILSGHNRVNAARLSGLASVPAVIKDGLPDDAAWMYVIETNLMQRSFGDLSHSEKAAVLATQHSKLFSQGKRNDILDEIEILEKSNGFNGNLTCGKACHKSGARDSIAKEYGLSSRTVANLLRINKLIPELKAQLDNGEISFIPSVTLSFLSAENQNLLNSCVELNGFAIDIKKADTLRAYSDRGKLDSDNIYLILSGELGNKPKQNRNPTVKVRKAVYSKYFSAQQSAKEVQDIVEKALEMYFASAGLQGGI